MTQYLYIILCKANISEGLYKIGVANDVESRLAQLQTGSPYELEITRCFEFKNSEIAERAIHQAYSLYRVRGEWFNLSWATLEKLYQLCEMLGGAPYVLNGPATTTVEAIEEAEEMSQPADGARWDYAAMFTDGWRMSQQDSRGMYWNWRRGSNENRRTIYGGLVSDLPHPIDEMRRIYGRS